MMNAYLAFCSTLAAGLTALWVSDSILVISIGACIGVALGQVVLAGLFAFKKNRTNRQAAFAGQQLQKLVQPQTAGNSAAQMRRGKSIRKRALVVEWIMVLVGTVMMGLTMLTTVMYVGVGLDLGDRAVFLAMYVTLWPCMLVYGRLHDLAMHRWT